MFQKKAAAGHSAVGAARRERGHGEERTVGKYHCGFPPCFAREPPMNKIIVMQPLCVVAGTSKMSVRLACEGNASAIITSTTYLDHM